MSLQVVGADEPLMFVPGKLVMYLRWNGLYPLYAEYARRSSMAVLGERTIIFYLEKAKYYLGKKRSKKFIDRRASQQWVNDAYCFDYERMNIELKQSEIDPDDIDTNNEILEINKKEVKQGDLPF